LSIRGVDSRPTVWQRLQSPVESYWTSCWFGDKKQFIFFLSQSPYDGEVQNDTTYMMFKLFNIYFLFDFLRCCHSVSGSNLRYCRTAHI